MDKTEKMTASRRTVIGGMGALAAALAAPQALAQDAKRPNMVFFLGEGLRNDAFDFLGGLAKTPNMTRIAMEGAHFTNAFCTNALCLPSRASFLTGCYPHTNGAVTNDEAVVLPQYKLVSDLLKEAGYDTAFIGKSHVGGALRDHDWDYYFGFNGQANYLHPKITEGSHGKYGPETEYSGYVDDLLTDKAVEYIDKRTSDKPFILFLWFYAPHAPFYRARRFETHFIGDDVAVPSTFNEDMTGYAGKPRAVANADNKIGSTMIADDDPRSVEELVKDYYAGVASNDEDVGRIMDSLRRKNVYDDTLLMLSSDHGFFLGEHHMYDKRLMYEPSIRIPMMVSYPKGIKAGTIRNEMVLNIDVAQTLLEFAGITAPSTMQGASFKPLCENKTVANWRKDWLYEYFEYPGYENVRPARGVRTERWKYINYFLAPEEFELYDLQNDPTEAHNLYGMPGFEQITETLRNRLEELRRETGDHYHWKPARVPKITHQMVPPAETFVDTTSKWYGGTK
ncbi:MAG: sulfatase [Asticcacaulis sp.]